MASDRMASQCHVGCAGWSIRPEHHALFAPDGSHLERYASRYPAVEINSSFYRPHQRATYARWAATVPAGFSFSVKAPKLLTHERQLLDTGPELSSFLREASGLGPKLGCVLIQLPPSLAYDPRTVESFLAALRARHNHTAARGQDDSAQCLHLVLAAAPAACMGAAHFRTA